MLDYFLTALIAYFGLAAGIALMRFAPEEQRTGKPYFLFLQKLLFYLMIVFLLASFSIHLVVMVIFLVISALVIFKATNIFQSTLFIYVIFGFLTAISYAATSLFVIESILIFLYGLPTASLFFNAKKKNYREIIYKTAWFFVPVILLFFIRMIFIV